MRSHLLEASSARVFSTPGRYPIEEVMWWARRSHARQRRRAAAGPWRETLPRCIHAALHVLSVSLCMASRGVRKGAARVSWAMLPASSRSFIETSACGLA